MFHELQHTHLLAYTVNHSKGKSKFTGNRIAPALSTEVNLAGPSGKRSESSFLQVVAKTGNTMVRFTQITLLQLPHTQKVLMYFFITQLPCLIKTFYSVLYQ